MLCVAVGRGNEEVNKSGEHVGHIIREEEGNTGCSSRGLEFP